MNAALQRRLLVLVAALGFLIAGTLSAVLMSQFLALIVLITTLDRGEVFQAHSPVLLFAIELIGCLVFTTAIVFATQSLIYRLGSGRVLLIAGGRDARQKHLGVTDKGRAALDVRDAARRRN